MRVATGLCTRARGGGRRDPVTVSARRGRREARFSKLRSLVDVVTFEFCLNIEFQIYKLSARGSTSRCQTLKPIAHGTHAGWLATKVAKSNRMIPIAMFMSVVAGRLATSTTSVTARRRLHN